MTANEKLIVKRLGFTTFALYTYIKANPAFHNKEMEFDIGLSKQSTTRCLRALAFHNIVTVNAKSRRNKEVTVNSEVEWTL